MVVTKASVAIVRGEQPSKMVETALGPIGAEGLVKPKDKVLINMKGRFRG